MTVNVIVYIKTWEARKMLDDINQMFQDEERYEHLLPYKRAKFKIIDKIESKYFQKGFEGCILTLATKDVSSVNVYDYISDVYYRHKGIKPNAEELVVICSNDNNLDIAYFGHIKRG